MSLDEDAVLRPGADVHWRRIEDETILLALDSEEYFALGPVGTEAWARIEDGATLALLVEEIAPLFEVDRGRLEDDLRSLLVELADTELIIVEPADTAE